jgi:hypothetical protein
MSNNIAKLNEGLAQYVKLSKERERFIDEFRPIMVEHFATKDIANTKENRGSILMAMRHGLNANKQKMLGTN